MAAIHKEDADLVIFYNLYVPRDEYGIRNAIEVIKDQMGQVAEALARMETEDDDGVVSDSSLGHNDKVGKQEERINDKAPVRAMRKRRGVLFYNLIGNERAFPPKEMSDLCRELHPRLECRLLKYHEEAGEAVTLQDLHDYCRDDVADNGEDRLVLYNNRTSSSAAAAASQRRVVYLHSKGSYHSQSENHIWRKQMTEAALHPQCLLPPDDSCDVCGAHFYVRYAITFPGNMWTTRCDYVTRLTPPMTGGGNESLIWGDCKSW